MYLTTVRYVFRKSFDLNYLGKMCGIWVQAARNGPSEDRKCWQRVELGIHGLKSWGRNWYRKGRSLYPKGRRRRWLHRKRLRPFGHRLLERSRDGHGVCFSEIEWLGKRVFWEKRRPIAGQKRESKPAAMRGQAGEAEGDIVKAFLAK